MKQSGRAPTGHAMRECTRCAVEYTMPFLIRQNGMLVCSGPGTNSCADVVGFEHYIKAVKFPRNEGYEPEPTANEIID